RTVGRVLPWSFAFFFFQAEDGIRDLTVTGVQTCALPISVSPLTPLQGQSSMRYCSSSRILFRACSRLTSEISTLPSVGPSWRRRSEERRVGKECRAGGARWHGRIQGCHEWWSVECVCGGS